METKITTEILSDFTYEVIERIARFIVHLEEIEVQFYNDQKRFKVKVELIDSYKKALFKLLSIVLIAYKRDIVPNNTDNYPSLFAILKDILKAVNELHADYLPVLPRPSEPVELTRFERVIHKQIIRLTKEEIQQKISISINEKIGEEICSDPLVDYNTSSISDLFAQHDLKNKYGIENLSIKTDGNDDKLHITIPRIDASNTFRWASLIHEMAHSLFNHFNLKFFKSGIEKEFLNSDFFANKTKETIFNGFFKPTDNINAFPTEDTLKNWLEECWCDLFASILIGHSFYFSQYLAFINEKEKKQDTDYIDHPPSTFRLDLIESILCSRFPIESCTGLTLSIDNCEGLLSLLLENNTMSFEKRPEIRQIYVAFCMFFKSHFIAGNKQDKKSGEISLKNNRPLREIIYKSS
ncbi:MAG: hypothetical protein LBG80_07255 [Bacteroidales bacterium]|jgi:hypothetical protein|nr:hypothetical protein [Bacteroidales bacterium]